MPLGDKDVAAELGQMHLQIMALAAQVRDLQEENGKLKEELNGKKTDSGAGVDPSALHAVN